MNDLIDLIDVIEEQCQQSELEVMIALTDVYVKSAIMMEMGYIEEPEDAEVYQESIKGTAKRIDRELNAGPVTGWSDESPIRRLLLFLPRLISRIIKILLLIIKAAIAIVVGLIALPGVIIAAKVVKNKYERESKEEIVIDFNLPFVAEFITEFGKFLQSTRDLAVNIDSYRTKKSEKNPAVQAVLLSENYTEEFKEYVNKFDSQAYKKTTTTVAEANLSIKALKVHEKFFKDMQKFVDKNLSDFMEDEKLTPEEQKTIRNFVQVCAEYVKKTNEFKQKLDSQMKKNKTEKKNSSNSRTTDV